jgi:hypothetical protein
METSIQNLTEHLSFLRAELEQQTSLFSVLARKKLEVVAAKDHLARARRRFSRVNLDLRSRIRELR